MPGFAYTDNYSGPEMENYEADTSKVNNLKNDVFGIGAIMFISTG